MDIDKEFESERMKFEQQRIWQRKIARIMSVCFLTILIGIGIYSVIYLSRSLSRHVLLESAVVIVSFSLMTGIVEYIKIKKMGNKSSQLFDIIYWILFGVMFFSVSRFME